MQRWIILNQLYRKTQPVNHYLINVENRSLSIYAKNMSFLYANKIYLIPQ